MQKSLLPALGLLLALGTTQVAHAQVNFIRMGMNATTLAKRANKNKADEAAQASTYQGKSFPMLRTPADKLPKKGAEQVATLETELDRSHAALLASDSGPLYTPEQRAALQAAIMSVAKVQSGANIAAYQQEAAFYFAEDARRQQAAAPAAAPAAPTN